MRLYRRSHEQAATAVLKWATIFKLETRLPFWCKYLSSALMLARMMAGGEAESERRMLVTPGPCARTSKEAAALSGADEPVARREAFRGEPAIASGLAGAVRRDPSGLVLRLLRVSQSVDPSLVTTTRSQSNLPPRVAQAQRFLARRGFASGQPCSARGPRRMRMA